MNYYKDITNFSELYVRLPKEEKFKLFEPNLGSIFKEIKVSDTEVRLISTNKSDIVFDLMQPIYQPVWSHEEFLYFNINVGSFSYEFTLWVVSPEGLKKKEPFQLLTT